MYIKYVHVLACCWLLLVVSYFSLYSQFCSLLGFIFGLSWSCLKMVMPQVVSFSMGKWWWTVGFPVLPQKNHKLFGHWVYPMNYTMLQQFSSGNYWVYPPKWWITTYYNIYSSLNYLVYRIRFYLSFINLQWNYGVSHMYYWVCFPMIWSIIGLSIIG
jgi:hypothetical protein